MFWGFVISCVWVFEQGSWNGIGEDFSSDAEARPNERHFSAASQRDARSRNAIEHFSLDVQPQHAREGLRYASFFHSAHMLLFRISFYDDWGWSGNDAACVLSRPGL